MLYIVIAQWSVDENQNGYFGPFLEEEAEKYRAYLLKGMPASEEQHYKIFPLSPTSQDYKLEEVSRGVVKGSKTAVALQKVAVYQEFLYFNTRFKRIHASSPDNEQVMIEQNGVIPVQCLEGPGKGRCSGVPKRYLVEPIIE